MDITKKDIKKYSINLSSSVMKPQKIDKNNKKKKGVRGLLASIKDCLYSKM